MMQSAETIRLLRESRAGGAGVAGTDADRAVVNKLSIRWQRETFESMGIQADFGITCLSNLYSDPMFKDPAVNRAFQIFPRVCQYAVNEAMKKEVPRRFAKKEPLQSEGKLTKDQILEFFTECGKMLLSSETAALIAEAKEAKEDFGQLCVNWQWQVFESLGIDYELGVRTLNMIPQEYASDLSMKTELVRFQQLCQVSVMKGTGMDTSVHERMLEGIESIVQEVCRMTMEDKKRLITRIVPKLQSLSQQYPPMEIMKHLDSEEDRRDYFTMVCMKGLN
jgi:hypothetical protein